VSRGPLAFAANLTTLFTERAFLDRFEAASEAGFEAVECQLPYGHPVEQIRRKLDEHGLALVLHNLPAGDWEAGERGIACHPDRIDEFDAGVELAMEYASALGCGQVNCLAGIQPAGVKASEARATLIRNVRFAARRLHGLGIALLVEPINTQDVPGFFLPGVTAALAVIREAGVDNVHLQFDAYHAHMMGAHAAAVVSASGSAIRHVQIADVPGRREPGTGTLDFEDLFGALVRAKYQGWIGCEYNPIGRTEDGLGWIQPYLSEWRI